MWGADSRGSNGNTPIGVVGIGLKPSCEYTPKGLLNYFKIAPKSIPNIPNTTPTSPKQFRSNQQIFENCIKAVDKHYRGGGGGPLALPGAIPYVWFFWGGTVAPLCTFQILSN